MSKLLRLVSYLKKHKIDSFLVTNPDNIFYLTGLMLKGKHPEREAYLIISPKENLFITDGRLIEQAKQVVPAEFKVREITYKTPINRLVKVFLKKNSFKKLGFEKDDLTVAEFENFTKKLPKIKLIGERKMIENLRLRKSQEEVEKIKEAAKITDKIFSILTPLIKPGKTELELVWKIKTLFNKFGTEGAFDPIVASGKNSAIPHYRPTSKKLAKGEIVLLDFGAKYQGYCSDLTRVVVLGKADNKIRHIYTTVLKAQEKAIKQIIKRSKSRKKIKAKEIDKIARDYILQQGFPSFRHGLGHGVGISIHEDPRLNPRGSVLDQGMVFTLEPGIYLPDWGGIRIEDLVYLGKGKIEILSQSSKELIEKL